MRDPAGKWLSKADADKLDVLLKKTHAEFKAGVEAERKSHEGREPGERPDGIEEIDPARADD